MQDVLDIENSHVPTLERDGSTLLFLPQNTVHGRPRGPGYGSQILLRQWDDRLSVATAVRLGELAEPSANAGVRVDVVRLDDSAAGSANLLGQQPEENVLHTRMASLEAREVVAENRASLSVLER